MPCDSFLMKVLFKKKFVGPMNNAQDLLEEHFATETRFSQKKKKNAKHIRWAVNAIQMRIKFFSLTSSLIIKGEKISICVCVCVFIINWWLRVQTQVKKETDIFVIYKLGFLMGWLFSFSFFFSKDKKIKIKTKK